MTTATKVIFRQFGGDSSSRTVKSGHTAIRADQFDPNGWQLPEIEELCQTDDQGVLSNYMTAIIAPETQMHERHQRGTMTWHPHAVADHGQKLHRTATELQHLIRQTFPRHRLSSRVVNK